MNDKHISLKLFLLFLLILLMIFVSLSTGDRQFRPLDFFNFITNQADTTSQFIIQDIRLPRILVSLLAGASLGMSGVLLQTFTKNPLADSGTLGINAGAGLVITLAMTKFDITDPFFIRYLPFIAMGGGLVTVAVTYFISHKKGERIHPVKIIVSGVTLSTILSSSLVAITGQVNREKLTYVVNWLAGKMTGNNWEGLKIAAPILIFLWFLTYLRAHKLNILQLNEETSIGLGLPLRLERIILLILVSSLVAFSLALAGNIVFIGMLASHISKRFFHADHRILLPTSMLWGAFLMLFADTLTRTFLIGTSIPTGITIALIGSPYFLYLLYQEGRRQLF